MTNLKRIRAEYQMEEKHKNIKKRKENYKRMTSGEPLLIKKTDDDQMSLPLKLPASQSDRYGKTN
jgi:hypothetical protein